MKQYATLINVWLLSNRYFVIDVYRIHLYCQAIKYLSSWHPTTQTTEIYVSNVKEDSPLLEHCKYYVYFYGEVLKFLPQSNQYYHRTVNLDKGHIVQPLCTKACSSVPKPFQIGVSRASPWKPSVKEIM